MSLTTDFTPRASWARRVTLCRCGASKNKPFCDGEHAAIGFQAGPAAAAK